MKKELSRLAGLAGQLEKLRGAVEDAVRGRAQGPASGSVRRPRCLEPEFVRKSRTQSSAFVEFSGAQLMEAPVGTVIEMADANGLRLTIRLAAGQPLDVAAVASLFRGTQR